LQNSDALFSKFKEAIGKLESKLKIFKPFRQAGLRCHVNYIFERVSIRTDEILRPKRCLRTERRQIEVAILFSSSSIHKATVLPSHTSAFSHRLLEKGNNLLNVVINTESRVRCTKIMNQADLCLCFVSFR